MISTGEPQLLSVACLFADVRGSTALTNSLGIVRMSAFVGEFLDEFDRIVHGEGGRVGNYSGDGALAVFSGDFRVDRAVAAASSLQSNLRQGNLPVSGCGGPEAGSTSRRLPFQVSTGIDVGSAVERAVGYNYRGTSWVGRCPNTSAKLTKRGDATASIAITEEALAEISSDCAIPPGLWTPAESELVGGETRTVFVPR